MLDFIIKKKGLCSILFLANYLLLTLEQNIQYHKNVTIDMAKNKIILFIVPLICLEKDIKLYRCTGILLG